MRTWVTIVALCAMAHRPAALAATVVKPELLLLAEERYDDDVLLRVGRFGQLISKLSPQVGLGIAHPTFKARGFYAADFLLHHGTGGLSLDHRAGLEASDRLSARADLSLKANLWRVTDPTSLPRLGLSYVMAPMLYGRLELGARAEATERVEGRLGYRFEGAQVLQPGRPVGLHHAPTAEGVYRLTRRASVGLEGRYQLFTLGAEGAMAAGGFGTFRYQLTRSMLLTAKAGPIGYQAGDGAAGVAPRFSLELGRTAEGLELGLAAGQDLAGASGFDAAVRAQYASAMVGLRVSEPLRLFAAAHLFRNGRPLGEGSQLLGPALVQGYAVGAGVEVRFNRSVSLFGTADRFAEAGADPTVPIAQRNILAVRLALKTR